MRKLFCLVVGLAALRLAGAPFAQEQSDLLPDPAAHFGALPNGVRYVVRANREPRDRASLRLLVLSGSLEESEDQRGLAHFLEHMAFNGSTHYPPGTLVEYFQRLGMSFGGDTNAYTSFDHTAYKIELPNVRPETIAEGLRVFADMAGGLLLEPAMINKERPIILSEERTRDSVGYRQFVASFNFLLPNSLLPRRMPIGLDANIRQAQQNRFALYYNRWYRPERMVVVVVGAIDPDAVIAQIGRAFGGVTDRAAALPEPDLGRVTTALGLKTAYHAEPEGPDTTVSISEISPYSYQPDTAELHRQHLRRDLAVAMLNRRLDILSKKEGAAFIRGSATIEENFNFVHDAEIELKCLPDRWREALATAEQELRRALQFGFGPAELAEAKANFGNELEQAATGDTTQRSEEIADGLVDSVVDRKVYTSPAQDLSLYRPLLATVTAEECAQALRYSFSLPGRYVMVQGNAVLAGDAPATIAQAYQAAHAVALRPPLSLAAGRFAYTDFGPPGRIVARRQIADLDITEVEFANGVRVNLKRTPFEANQIRIRLRAGTGRLQEPPTEPGLSFFSDLTFASGGLGRHSADDLQTLLAGKTVSLEFAAKDDAFEMTAATNRDDLLLQLQLLAAYLTDPGYRPESLRVATKTLDELYTEFAHTVSGPLETKAPRYLAAGDRRFGLPDRSEMQSRTLAEEKAWLGPQLASGPVEIALAGDLEIEPTLDALARTLGALPPRGPKPACTAERQVHFPPPPAATIRWTVESQIPKAAVAVYWPTNDDRDVHRTRRLNLLAEVFGDRLRLRLREQLGAAYSPEAASLPTDAYPGYGKLVAEVVVAPARVDETVAAILAIADNLQKSGVSADELERAKKPLLTSLRESARTNQYWLIAVLGNCQEFPMRLDWARSREADVRQVTKPEIDALARAYLEPAHAFPIVVTPQ